MVFISEMYDQSVLKFKRKEAQNGFKPVKNLVVQVMSLLHCLICNHCLVLRMFSVHLPPGYVFPILLFLISIRRVIIVACRAVIFLKMGLVTRKTQRWIFLRNTQAY